MTIMSSSSRLLKFTNCKILRNHDIVTDDLWVRNGKIINPEPLFYDEKINTPDVTIDCNGALISPGFIDIQINGAIGIDFSHHLDDIENGIQKVSKFLLSHGITSFCPTLVTSSPETYRKVLPKLKATAGGKWGATILGAHVEGPFINVTKRGAHASNLISAFHNGVSTLYDIYGSLENIKIITLAPELENAFETIQYLSKKNVIVSLGHSTSDIKLGEKAVRMGASMITHLFNAMMPFHHRDPGLVGLLASAKTPRDNVMYFGIICDGHHTHPSAIRIAHRTYFPGLILVTDGISALGLEDGIHHIGEQLIQVKNNAAYLANSETLAGSVTPMYKCIQLFLEYAGCTIVEALEAATSHPACALGLHHKGTLNFEADADFVFLDHDLNVLSTWISGECVYHCVAI